MGRVAGPYGLLGWIKVFQPVEALAACRNWWIDGIEYRVLEAREHSGTLLARLAGLGDRDAALRLKGRTVAVARDALPQPEAGHYYHADLVGMEVVNTKGAVLGTVQAMSSYGAHDVMEVAARADMPARARRLLPWVAAVVRNVDPAARRIEVQWEADW
ncbi:MAG: 16S rRNA processing protein RimM [Betaproteobacteria bacterium]|nr:16S rRNA processing protein RimM [Betaproteobacteria bacterium]